jgi:hypothetical protein
MKLTIAFLSIITILGFGACSTASTGTKPVVFNTCTPGGPGKVVLLESNSFAPGGTVVRLAH